MADLGNPNFFTTFKGRYLLVPAPAQSVDTDVVMLTSANDVQPIGDWTILDYQASETFGTLPNECRPKKEVKIPVVIDTAIDILSIQTNGDMSLANSHDAGILYLSGINFNISDNWY